MIPIQQAEQETQLKDMITATQAMNSKPWIVPATFSAVFLGYLVVIFMNIPPFVRSNHVSVNSNMLSITGIGILSSAIALAAILFGSIAKHVGKVSTWIISVEASLTLILSTVLFYRSLRFFLPMI